MAHSKRRKKLNLSELGTIDFKRFKIKPRDSRGKFVQQFLLSWNELKELKLGFKLKGIAYIEWGAEALRENSRTGKYGNKNKMYRVFVQAARKYPDDWLQEMLDLIYNTWQYRDIHWKGKVYKNS